MKWNKFRLKTTTEAEDIVSSMLADLGIEGVEIEDKIPLTESDKEQMFVDILPEIEADDGVAYLSFYLEEDEDKEKVLANVKKELEEGTLVEVPVGFSFPPREIGFVCRQKDANLDLIVPFFGEE